MFPYCACTNRSSDGQPYYINGFTSRAVNSSVTEFSFTVRYRGPRANPDYCYRALQQNLNKIAVHVREWSAAKLRLSAASPPPPLPGCPPAAASLRVPAPHAAHDDGALSTPKCGCHVS